MKNKLFLMGVALGILLPLQAQVQCGDSAYSVRLDAGYAYNKTYSHYGNFDLGAYMPIHRAFEMQADVRLSVANFYTAGVQLRPKFAVPVGEMYVETRAMYRAIVRNHINEFNGGLALGYRMQYVDVMVGCGMRMIGQMPMEWGGNEKYVLEPFLVLYKVQAFVRPQTSSWNITLMISNIDDYQMERPQQPLYAIGGWYNVDNHWRVRLSSEFKFAGIAHLNANFYGADLRAGVEYRF